MGYYIVAAHKRRASVFYYDVTIDRFRCSLLEVAPIGTFNLGMFHLNTLIKAWMDVNPAEFEECIVSLNADTPNGFTQIYVARGAV